MAAGGAGFVITTAFRSLRRSLWLERFTSLRPRRPVAAPLGEGTATALLGSASAHRCSYVIDLFGSEISSQCPAEQGAWPSEEDDGMRPKHRSDASPGRNDWSSRDSEFQKPIRVFDRVRRGAATSSGQSTPLPWRPASDIPPELPVRASYASSPRGPGAATRRERHGTL